MLKKSHTIFRNLSEKEKAKAKETEQEQETEQERERFYGIVTAIDKVAQENIRCGGWPATSTTSTSPSPDGHPFAAAVAG